MSLFSSFIRSLQLSAFLLVMFQLSFIVPYKAHGQAQKNIKKDAFSVIEKFLEDNAVLLTAQQADNNNKKNADKAMREKFRKLLDPSSDFFPDVTWTHNLKSTDLAFLGGYVFESNAFTAPASGSLPKLRIIATNKQIVGVGSSRYRLYYSLNELASFAASADVTGNIASIVQGQFKAAYSRNFDKSVRLSLASGTFENKFASIIRKSVETMEPQEFLPLYYLWTEYTNVPALVNDDSHKKYILGNFNGIIIETTSSKEYNGHIDANANLSAGYSAVPFIDASVDAQAEYKKHTSTRNEYENTEIFIHGTPQMQELPNAAEIKRRWDYLSSNVSKPLEIFITPTGENKLEVQFGPVTSRDQLRNIHLVKDKFVNSQVTGKKIVNDITIAERNLSGGFAVLTLQFAPNDNFFKSSVDNETSHSGQIKLRLGNGLPQDSLLIAYPLTIWTNGIITPEPGTITVSKNDNPEKYEWTFPVEFNNVPTGVTLTGNEILGKRVTFKHANTSALISPSHLTTATCNRTVAANKYDCKIVLTKISSLLSPTDDYLACELELKVGVQRGAGITQTTRKLSVDLTGITPPQANLPLNGITYMETPADIARVISGETPIGSIKFDSLRKQIAATEVITADSAAYFTALGDIIIKTYQLSRDAATHRFILNNYLIDRNKMIKLIARRRENNQ